LKDTATTFKVFGVCEQCKQRIEGALKVKGIKSAVWNIDSKMLSVSYSPSKISLEKIHNRIAAGHDTYLKKANVTSKANETAHLCQTNCLYLTVKCTGCYKLIIAEMIPET
jgi:copper chaperone CopZ